MKILLPSSDNYSYRNGLATLSDGILRIQKCCEFSNIMYDFTYAIYGKTHCYYCGAEFYYGNEELENVNRSSKKNSSGKSFLSPAKITLDHMYPTSVGGPTIPNNLIPCCKNCNNRKSFLTEEEYNFFLSLPKSKRREYQQDVSKYRYFQLKWHGIMIPQEWFTYGSIRDISVNISLDLPIHKKYAKISEYYNTYGHLPAPLVVDSNFYLLDGFARLLFAKNNSLKNIPIICLENVQYVR